MKNLIASFFFLLLCTTARSQCEDVAVQISSSSPTSVQLYHAGFFNIPSGFANVCDWEVTDFSGAIILQETTSGAWADQSFMLYNHSVPLTDSMKVDLLITNETSGITCFMSDTLTWVETEILPGSFIGAWEVLSSNPGAEVTLDLELVTATDVTCFGGNDGSISVVASGGDAPYTFSIDNGPPTTSTDFAGLEAGEHIIIVTDFNGVTKSLTVVLSEPFEYILDINEENITCFEGGDGEIFALASGGTSTNGYKYFIDGTGPFTTGLFTNLEAGTYEIIVEDDNACLISKTVEITQPDQIVVVDIELTHLVCFSDANGSIDFTVTGGTSPYTYTYNDQSSTTLPITDLTAGEYSITVSDQDSCTFVFDFEILSPDALTLVIGDLVNNSCDEEDSGSVTLEGSGGTPDYTYSIEPESNTTGLFDNLASGDYTANVEDGNGCSAEVMFTIGLEIDLDVEYEISNLSCFGDSTGNISVQIAGGNDGYTFYLNQVEMPSAVFPNLDAGIYEIKIEGSNDCAFTDSVTIFQPAEITLNDLVVTSPQCSDDFNGQIQFTIAGGVPGYQVYFGGDTLTTMNGEVVFTDIGVGQVTFSIEDSLGCIINEVLTINHVSILSLDSIIVDNVNCSTGEFGSIEVIASSGQGEIIYFLDTLANTTGIFDGLEDGTYMIEVMDTLGCTVNKQITISLEGQINGSIDQIQDVSCFGMMDGSVSISVEGNNEGYEFQLDSTTNTTGNFTDLSPGEYLVLITNAQNCISTIEFEIGDIEPLLLEIVDVVNDDGTGNGSVTVESTGGTESYLYSIDGGISFQIDPLFSGLDNGTYTVWVQDENNCTDSLTVTLMTTSTQELDLDVNFKIYPSPTQLGNEVNIVSESIIESISVVNTQGQFVRENFYNLRNVQVQTINFTEGIYFLGIKTNERVSWKKVVLVK